MTAASRIGAAALGLGLCLGAAPAAAATSYRLGASAQAGFNSALVQPVQILGETSNTVAGLTLTISPFVQVGVETGRVSLALRYVFVADGILLVPEAATAFSYQNRIDAEARFDLTAKLAWLLGLAGSQGRLNSFVQAQNPGTQLIEAPNLFATEFVSATASSVLQWDVNARLRISQPLSFRAFIPYGNITRTNVLTRETVTENVTGALQSMSLDGGLGFDYQWARTSLGGEARFGYFLPQRGFGQVQDVSQALVTGQAALRGRAELSPRWRGEAQVGVYAATQPDAFLRGKHITGEGETIREVQGTLVTPIGGASLSYIFPKVDAQLSLNYLHGAAAEVFIGRLTLSDSVTLRAIVPLPRDLSLSAAVGYRYADLYTGSLSRATYGVPALPAYMGDERTPATAADERLSLGQTYSLVLADAALGWAVRDGVQLYARYAFQYQKVQGDPVNAAQVGLQDFARHLALVGVSLYWPTDKR